MDWLTEHWQTVLALAIVGVTALVFLRKALRPREKSGCSGGCGCEAAKHKR